MVLPEGAPAEKMGMKRKTEHAKHGGAPSCRPPSSDPLRISPVPVWGQSGPKASSGGLGEEGEKQHEFASVGSKIAPFIMIMKKNQKAS